VLNFANSRLDLIGGNLMADLTTALVVGPKNSQASGDGLTMKFSLASGLFSGKKLDPATSRGMSFNGVVLQKMNAGYGYLLGTNQTSQVVLTP
jgi:hypothetical protein